MRGVQIVGLHVFTEDPKRGVELVSYAQVDVKIAIVLAIAETLLGNNLKKWFNNYLVFLKQNA